MNRRVTFPPVGGPPPPTLDAGAVMRAFSTIEYQFNLLSGDVDRMSDAIDNLQSRSAALEARQNADHMMLDDLYSLVNFLEQNPDADLKDWVRYEQVKEKMRKAADVG